MLKVAKVLAYAGGSAVLAAAISILNEVEVPVQYATHAVVINLILVSLQKYLTGTK